MDLVALSNRKSLQLFLKALWLKVRRFG